MRTATFKEWEIWMVVLGMWFAGVCHGFWFGSLYYN
jgi:hypothetical protein